MVGMTASATSGHFQPRPDLNYPQAAAYSGLSTSTLRRLIASGELEARRIGKRAVRIRQADLDALGTPLGPQD